MENRQFEVPKLKLLVDAVSSSRFIRVGRSENLIDKFGENTHTGRINEDQFKATVTVTASKTFYAWCFRFAGQMKIAGLRKVKGQYLEMTKKILE